VHRHHQAPQGGKFAVAASHDGVIVGVAIVGRPVSRALDDGETAEVIRVATDGTSNACSFLYAKAKRAAQALGYTRVITYTLPEESGASLRAIGARLIRLTRAQTWNRPSRPRVDSHPTGTKQLWELQS